jgi:hypothetical protein
VTAGRVAFAAAAGLYLIGVVVQVFLAGAGLFKLTDWTAHTGLGWTLGSAPLLLLIVAFLARPGRTTILLTAALTAAAIVQPELATARYDAPVIAALHPVNALLVFWLAWLVARRAAVLLVEDRKRARRPAARRPAPAVPGSRPTAAPPAAPPGSRAD